MKSWQIFGLLCGLGFPAQVLAQNPQENCEALFQKKQFQSAGDCYLTKAKAMSGKLSKIQTYLKGQHLNNAAIAYQKAGSTEKTRTKAAYIYEQAYQILAQYLKENLCQKDFLCRQAKGRQLELLNKIGYATLTIVTTPQKKAALLVEGYKFRKTHTSPPQWSQRIRPGNYKLTITYLGKKPKTKEIVVVPKKPTTITMLAPTKTSPQVVIIEKREKPKERKPVITLPPTQPNPLPWIVLGSGGVLAAVGGILLGVSVISESERDQLASNIRAKANAVTPAQRAALLDDPNVKKNIEDADALHQDAKNFSTIGWIGLGVGAGVAIVGAILVVVMRPKTQTMSHASPLDIPNTATLLYSHP